MVRTLISNQWNPNRRWIGTRPTPTADVTTTPIRALSQSINSCYITNAIEPYPSQAPDQAAAILKLLFSQFIDKNLLNIKEFRQSMEMLTKHDWAPPIAYPQVVFLAVRVYFIICLISRQYLLSVPPTEAQSVIPVMTILQFIFFVGWMKNTWASNKAIFDRLPDEKGTMYWCHPTKNGSQAPPTAVAISQHKNPFSKVLNMVHPSQPESSPPSYRLEVPK
ncbi:hypothetical protein B9Z55_012231 [Caenorhabditis nigoni]|uniref:Bestrophin homolog n=1 Tax=Caenorhabditis nigoni TaxID=1611254 RepID=A0A2G5TWD6_9PELO|nr:hypothetical protein B9Z55_012231 [Caenorhabditis nigoni]